MKKQRLLIWLFLGIYIVLLVNYTLVDGSFGRNILNIKNLNFDSLVNYMETSLNLIPFATIKLYINGLKSDNISFGYFLINIFGNLLMLMPLSFFVPTLIEKIDTFPKLLIFVILFAICIEILQILFLTGSCDIDDVILNVIGAIIAYSIFKSVRKNDKLKEKAHDRNS